MCFPSKKRKHHTSLNRSCNFFLLFIHFHRKLPTPQTQTLTFIVGSIHPRPHHPLTLGVFAGHEIGISAVTGPQCRGVSQGPPGGGAVSPVPVSPRQHICGFFLGGNKRLGVKLRRGGFFLFGQNWNAMDNNGELMGLMAELMVNCYETVHSKWMPRI